MPPYYAWYAAQSNDCGSILFDICCSPCGDVKLKFILSLFCLLQVQCANCRLSRSLGCPPFAIGIIWSIVLDIGCGYFKDISTGFPHIPQMFWEAYIRRLFISNCPLCVPSRSGLFRIAYPLRILLNTSLLAFVCVSGILSFNMKYRFFIVVLNVPIRVLYARASPLNCRPFVHPCSAIFALNLSISFDMNIALLSNGAVNFCVCVPASLNNFCNSFSSFCILRRCDRMI